MLGNSSYAGVAGHRIGLQAGFLALLWSPIPDARKVRAAAPCVGCVRVRPTLAFELRAHPSVPWQMARGARRSSTSPSAPTVTQHAEANQAAAQSPTAGGGAPAAGPDAPEEVATLRAQIEALQLRLAAAPPPAGGGQQGGGGAAAATAQSTTPARSHGGGQPTPDPPTQPRRRGGRRRTPSEDPARRRS